MAAVDKFDTGLRVRGVLEVIRDKGTPREFSYGPQPNLILNGAGKILRDLMFGDSASVTKMFFGDMNLDPLQDDIVNVDPPQKTDTALTNKLFEKSVTKSKTLYSGNPAVKFEVTLDAGEFNGSGEQLITELGLANSSSELFSRKTRSAIFKNAQSSLTFVWYLIFV